MQIARGKFLNEKRKMDLFLDFVIAESNIS